jgi:hypothetical protein
VARVQAPQLRICQIVHIHPFLRATLLKMVQVLTGGHLSPVKQNWLVVFVSGQLPDNLVCVEIFRLHLPIQARADAW